MKKEKRGIFFEPKYSTYAEHISIASPSEARESVEWAEKESKCAKRPSKVLRILRSLVLARNRAEALQKKRNLSAKERRELKKVVKIYDSGIRKVKKIYERKKARRG